MLTSYPYADPQYGAMLTYGAPVRTDPALILPRRKQTPFKIKFDGSIGYMVVVNY